MDKIFDKLPYDALSKLKLPHYLIIALVLAGGAFGGYYFTLHGDIQAEYEAQQKKKNEAETKFKKYNMEVAKKPMLLKQVSELVGDLSEKKRLMIVEQDLPTLLSRVTDMGAALNVRIYNFEIKSKTKKKDFYREIPLSMEISGPYYHILGFFDSLQNLLSPVTLSSVSFKASKAKNITMEEGKKKISTYNVVNTKIKAKTYAYIEGSENKPAPK